MLLLSGCLKPGGKTSIRERREAFDRMPPPKKTPPSLCGFPQEKEASPAITRLLSGHAVQMMLYREDSCLHATVEIELAQDALHMDLDG